MLLYYNILSEQKYEFFCSFAIVELIYFVLRLKTNHPVCSGLNRQQDKMVVMMI